MPEDKYGRKYDPEARTRDVILRLYIKKQMAQQVEMNPFKSLQEFLDGDASGVLLGPSETRGGISWLQEERG